MAEKAQISAVQRAQNFALATRENLQMLSKQAITGGATQIQFNLPKARLLTKVMIIVNAKVKLTHATETSLATDEFTAERLIRKLTLDMNNGFAPISLSGLQAKIYSFNRLNSSTVHTSNVSGMYNYVPSALTASSSGVENSLDFAIEVPVVLNDNALTGMLMLQNSETNVNLNIDIANGNDVIKSASGYTCEITSGNIEVMVQTFSIPSSADAFPDLSVLKIVTGRTQNIANGGDKSVALSTGGIYRNIMFMLEDTDGVALADADITAPIQLVFNTADINYSISARALRKLNTLQLGYPLPKGVYMFPFAYNGIANLGGTRDFIDTSKLTEFELRFTTANGVRLNLITEEISQLK